MNKYSSSLVSVLVLFTISLVACSHKLTQDELDAKVNQEISQTTKNMMAEPFTGKPLCMTLTTQDFASVGFDPHQINIGDSRCYDQRSYAPKNSRMVTISYLEHLAETTMSLDDPSSFYIKNYANYHVVHKHPAGNPTFPAYRVNADVITINKMPVIREYAPKIPLDYDYDNEKPAESSQCTLLTRIPQGFILLTYEPKKPELISKHELCGNAEKILSHLLHQISIHPPLAPYCLTIDSAWLKKHNLIQSDIYNSCQSQYYYLLQNNNKSPQTTAGGISVSMDSDNYYQKDPRYKKSMLNKHTIYTEIKEKTSSPGDNVYDILIPTTDHKTLIISPGIPHSPASALQHAVQQIALYEINHNLPK